MQGCFDWCSVFLNDSGCFKVFTWLFGVVSGCVKSLIFCWVNMFFKLCWVVKVRSFVVFPSVDFPGF